MTTAHTLLQRVLADVETRAFDGCIGNDTETAIRRWLDANPERGPRELTASDLMQAAHECGLPLRNTADVTCVVRFAKFLGVAIVQDTGPQAALESAQATIETQRSKVNYSRK